MEYHTNDSAETLHTLISISKEHSDFFLFKLNKVQIVFDLIRFLIKV